MKYVNIRDIFPVKKLNKYKVYIKYTDGSKAEHYCLGYDEDSAYEDIGRRLSTNTYRNFIDEEGYIETKQIKSYKLGEQV